MEEKKKEEKILSVDFSDEFSKSYIDYSMSVITARAIPDARDGLKPVQRRVIYDMGKLNLSHDKPTKKCARIVGDTMGKYHPHGDSSIYEALVVMTQDFKKQMPLVDGQGNLGSIEGDGAAAQRYTEARLQKFSEDILLSDLKDTVEFTGNYDDTEKEPVVLPARLPMLLINGSEGIAVGMTTSTPSHNVGEVCDLCKAYIDKPKMSISEMMKYMPGPDFPTGGIISNKKDLEEIYKTGSGKIKIRGKIEFEKAKNKRDKDKLVITEIPYTMIGSGIEKFLYDVAALVEAKKINDIVDIANQSSKEGIRIVLELKAGADVEYIKNVLLKKTKLEDTFGVNMLAIADGRPETLTLSRVMEIWYEFQKEITRNKYQAILNDCLVKREVYEGLLKACEDIDLIIAVIRGSKSIADATECLTTGKIDKITFKTKAFAAKAAKLNFTLLQAESILKMQLQKLIGLEIETLKKQHKENEEKIKTCEKILTNTKELNNLLKKEITRYKKEYFSERKTVLDDCSEIVYVEKKNVFEGYVLIDKFRYCKMIDMATYDRNKDTIPEQYVHAIKTSSDSKLFVFTNKGLIHQVKCESIPLRKYKDKGEPLENLSAFKSEENILCISHLNDPGEVLLFATKEGLIKLVHSFPLGSSKKTVAATKLNEGDELTSVLKFNKEKYLLLYNNSGYLLKLNTEDIPLVKKTSLGVKGISLKPGELSNCYFANQEDEIQIGEKKVKVNSLKSAKKGSAGKKI